MSTPLQRQDLEAIVGLIADKASVLDLGCGDGALLARLVAQKEVMARGVEIDESNVRACIGRGLSVRQGNIEEGLEDYRDGMFDYVVLSQTLAYLDHPANVVTEMLRVGRHAIISFDNAGYWWLRLRALRGARSAFDLCNSGARARSITTWQFGGFTQCVSAKIKRSIFMSGARQIQVLPSLLAQVAVYEITQM